MSNIWAIILAAGESKRMKVPKMLLPYKGKTILEQVIENVINSQVDKTVVVLGSDKDEILKLTERWPVSHSFNNNYKDGMLSSVKCGFRYLPSGSGAAVIFLGDQPMVGPEITDMVISAFRSSGKGIIVPVFGGKRGHPLLISLKYRDEVESINQADGLRALARSHPDDVFEVKIGTHDILRDIDTPEDYSNELKQI